MPEGGTVCNAALLERRISEHGKEVERHDKHRRKTESQAFLHLRRGHELSPTQSRNLFAGTIDLDEIAGYKLNKRQRAQVKVLKAERSGRTIKMSTRTKAATQTVNATHATRRRSKPHAQIPQDDHRTIGTLGDLGIQHKHLVMKHRPTGRIAFIMDATIRIVPAT